MKGEVSLNARRSPVLTRMAKTGGGLAAGSLGQLVSARPVSRKLTFDGRDPAKLATVRAAQAERATEASRLMENGRLLRDAKAITAVLRKGGAR